MTVLKCVWVLLFNVFVENICLLFKLMTLKKIICVLVMVKRFVTGKCMCTSVYSSNFALAGMCNVASALVHNVCVMHGTRVWWQLATLLFCNTSCHLRAVVKGLCSAVCYLTSTLLKTSHLHLEWMPYCQQGSVPCRQIPRSLSASHLSLHRLKQSRRGITHTNWASQPWPE